jgi:hypothetical protein
LVPRRLVVETTRLKSRKAWQIGSVQVDTSDIVISPEERARVLEHLLEEGMTYSIAFMCGGKAIQKDGQTKAEVVNQSRMYLHFQFFQPGGLNLAGFEAVHRIEDTGLAEVTGFHRG